MNLSDIIIRDFRKLVGVHRDERGTISIVAVFALIILAMLLGMVINVGYQADSKVKMQNAADAATYSGGVVMARGMNTLAFTNHLLCDVFALTAFLREGADNRGVEYVPEILEAWQELAPQYEFDDFNRFQNWNGQYYGQNISFSIPTLTEAINNKVPKEQEMVRAFAEWAAAFSDQVLPTLEEILNNELIPEYQRAVVDNVPGTAQTAMNLVAHAHGVRPDGETHETRGPLQGMLWTARAEPVNTFTDFTNRSLPVVDPVRDAMPEQQYYLEVARAWRNSIAQNYLNQWNNEKLAPFRYVGGMSQYYYLWISFTCGRLRQLQYEHEMTNLPFIIYTPPDVIQAAINDDNILRTTVRDEMKLAQSSERNDFLEQNNHFVGVVYWPRVTHILPGLFDTPVSGDNISYSQVSLFIPRNRLAWGSNDVSYPVRQGRSTGWDLFTQSWRVQLVPATHPSLLAILQTTPTFDGQDDLESQEISLPDLGELGDEDIFVISHH
jgi:hypothetical protein